MPKGPRAACSAQTVRGSGGRAPGSASSAGLLGDADGVGGSITLSGAARVSHQTAAGGGVRVRRHSGPVRDWRPPTAAPTMAPSTGAVRERGHRAQRHHHRPPRRAPPLAAPRAHRRHRDQQDRRPASRESVDGDHVGADDRRGNGQDQQPSRRRGRRRRPGVAASIAARRPSTRERSRHVERMSGVKMHSWVTMNAPWGVRMMAPETAILVPAAARMVPPGPDPHRGRGAHGRFKRARGVASPPPAAGATPRSSPWRSAPGPIHQDQLRGRQHTDPQSGLAADAIPAHLAGLAGTPRSSWPRSGSSHRRRAATAGPTSGSGTTSLPAETRPSRPCGDRGSRIFRDTSFDGRRRRRRSRAYADGPFISRRARPAPAPSGEAAAVRVPIVAAFPWDPACIPVGGSWRCLPNSTVSATEPAPRLLRDSRLDYAPAEPRRLPQAVAERDLDVPPIACNILAGPTGRGSAGHRFASASCPALRRRGKADQAATRSRIGCR